MPEFKEAHPDFHPVAGRRFQVVSLGMNAVDWICRVPVYPAHNSKVPISEMHKLGGGPAATAAALCARYGLRVKYVGRVGDDEIGEFSLQDLRREPMDICHVETIAGAKSQFAVIIVDRPSGERTVLWQRDPALNYGPGELKPEWIACGQVLHLDGHEIPSRIQAAAWAKQAGMSVSLDIDQPDAGVEELLNLTDFALPTERFVQRFSGCLDWRQGLRKTASAVKGLTAVTRGQAGCAVFWEGEIVEIPSFPVKVIESTGAGDVFHGAFVYGLFQDWPLERCLRFANAAGALSCTGIGARSGIPRLERVLSLLDGE